MLKLQKHKFHFLLLNFQGMLYIYNNYNYLNYLNNHILGNNYMI